MNYSDNLDEYHLDSPPNKKSRKQNVPKTLREPSQTRISAQEMMKLGELQHSLSPHSARKLLGTAIKEESDEKPTVKMEKVKTEKEIDYTVNTKRKNRKWPTDARLVHVDRTPCSTECMQTHKDDSDDETPTELNKSIKATYGETANKEPIKRSIEPNRLSVVEHGVNSKETVPATLVGVPLKETLRDAETHPQSQKETNLEQNKTLHGVPLNENLAQKEKLSENLNENRNKDDTSMSELQGVPQKTTAELRDECPDNTIEEFDNSSDTALINEDVTLPVLEPVKEQGEQESKNIDLQQELTPENVTMDTDILDELREFDSVLNLGDSSEYDLPLVGGQYN